MKETFMISYEWALESVNVDDDIEDSYFSDSLKEVKNTEPCDGCTGRIALIRNDGNEDDGLKDRQYAYFQNGMLVMYFDGGIKVPKRFLNEVKNNS